MMPTTTATRALLFAAALLVAPLPAFAADAVPTEKDPVSAERAVKLGEKLLLWGGPPLLLLLGAFAMFRIVQARRRTADEPPLTAEERARAARLLGGDSGKDQK